MYYKLGDRVEVCIGTDRHKFGSLIPVKDFDEIKKLFQGKRGTVIEAKHSHSVLIQFDEEIEFIGRVSREWSWDDDDLIPELVEVPTPDTYTID